MHKKHFILMLACCLIPIAGIIAISTLSIQVTSVMQIALVLVCPLMMLLMMIGMRDHGPQHEHSVTPTDKRK